MDLQEIRAGRLNSLPKGMRFLVAFAVGLAVAIALYWIYAVLMPELRGYEQWGWLWKTLFYGLVLYLGLWAFRFASSPNAQRVALGWPFQPLSQRLPSDKNIWDWLTLIGGTTLIGIVASIISFFVTQSNQDSASMLQDRKERQQILNDYIREMTSLVKSQSYNNMTPELKTAISTRTLNALEDLSKDHVRQGYILRFAVRSFPGFTCHEEEMADPRRSCPMPSNIAIRDIQLVNFRRLKNSKVPRGLFEGADLTGANLKNLVLEDSLLTSANLTNANLSKAYLTDVSLESAKLDGADLSEAVLVKTNLKYATGLHSVRLDGAAISTDSDLPNDFNPCELMESKKLLIRAPQAIAQMSPGERVKTMNKHRAAFYTKYGCYPWPIENAQNK